MNPLSQSLLVLRPRETVLPGVTCLVLAACSHSVRTVPPPQTHVDYQSVATPDTHHYVLRPGESSTHPKLIERPAPGYPASMIPLHLAQVTVRVKVIVGTNGKVDDVRIAHTGAAYPGMFDQAVHDAVSNWRYTPLQFLRWRDEYDAQGKLVGSHQVAVESKPFSLDYEFHFNLRDGRPVVASTQASAK
jgi:TonB family protein